MKKAILLSIITTSLVTGNAQMHNFMGNHVILNMEAYFSPAWLNPNPMTPYLAGKGEALQRYLGLNYFLSPSVELIVWKQGTVGAGYNYYHTPFSGQDERVKIHDGYWGYDSYASLQGDLTAHGFNVYYKQYLGNGFAPLGHHFKFTFDGYFYHYRMDSTASVIPNGIPYDELPSVMENKGCIFGLKAEYGYDFILFDRLKLTVGVSVGSTFGGYRVPNARIHEEFSAFDLGEAPNKPIYFDNHARARILGAYWFGAKLGIGFIAF